MKLDNLIPGVSTAKLMGYGAAALAAAVLVGFAWFTVKGWRDDAARLPVVQGQLDQSKADNRALTKQVTTEFSWIAGKIGENEKRALGVTGQVAANQASIASDINTFLKRFNNAPSNPACDVPQSVRDGLLQLFALYVPTGSAASVGGTSGDGQGQPSGTATGAPAVPGRQQSDNHQGKMGMSTPAGSPASNPNRELDGDRRAPDRSASSGNGSAGPAERLGAPRRGWLGRAFDTLTKAVSLAGATAVQTAQDDRRDGR